jgi:hypothetical protein
LRSTSKTGSGSLHGRLGLVRSFEFLDLPPQLRQERFLVIDFDARGFSRRENKLLAKDVGYGHSRPEPIMELGESREPLALGIHVSEQRTNLALIKNVELFHLRNEVLVGHVAFE